LWYPYLRTGCAGCHSSGGLADGETEFIMIREDTEEALTQNFQTLSTIASEQVGGTSILLLRPSGQHPDGHPGGVRAREGSVAYAALSQFVGRLDGRVKPCDFDDAIACLEPFPGRRQIRRLTGYEYDATVQDLTGYQSSLGQSHTAPGKGFPFPTYAAQLTADEFMVTKWLEAADIIAADMLERLDQVAPCSGTERTCAESFIRQFGARAFRRPITDEEVTRYLDLYDYAAEDGYAEGIRDLVTAFLVSPYFVYRTELGETSGDSMTVDLTPYEIASQLSYMLIGSMPDQALIDAAAAGDLDTPTGIQTQVDRLLDDPRSTETIQRFVVQWMHVDRLLTSAVSRDDTAYPGFAWEVRQAMMDELASFVAGIRESGGSFSDLMTSTSMNPNQTLADFYGIEPGPQELADRPGLLARPAVLTTHAFPQSGSPIHRGVLVRERLFCYELEPPPNDLVVMVPEIEEGVSNRERFEQHSDQPACSGCHELIDPLGFGFEAYNGVGAFINDSSIDATGAVTHTESTNLASFDGLDELAGQLGQSTEVAQCFTEMMVQQGYGIRDDYEYHCLGDSIWDDLGSEDPTFDQVLNALTRSAFVTRRVRDDITYDDWVAAHRPDEPTPDDDPEMDMGMDMSGLDAGFDGSDLISDASVEEDVRIIPNEDLEVVEVRNDDWGAGYCRAFELTNMSSSSLDWELTLSVDGVINNLWEATADGDSGTVTFGGLNYNNELAPNGGMAGFGFCAER
ncbi:MAG: DUF1592 domain-containing protein, partial [Myxococcales bacterium]|nr:DUF1592 domain-containing protein [Myxococcales bacterium]